MATDNNLQVLRRALRLLECFHVEQPKLSLPELCRKLDIPKSTIHRLLIALVEEDYLVYDKEKQKYHLSPKIVRLAQAAIGQVDLERCADLAMHQLVSETSGTANLAVLDRTDGLILYLKTVHRDLPLTNVGRRSYIHNTALGKMLTAYQSPVLVRQMLEKHGMPPSSEYTITDPDAFLAHLEKVRRQGYALDDEEANRGFRCIAAPVQDHTGNVVAGISMTGTTYLVTRERVPEFAQLICERAHGVSRMLGCPEDQLLRSPGLPKGAFAPESPKEVM